jgi:hypothetical protein
MAEGESGCRAKNRRGLGYVTSFTALLDPVISYRSRWRMAQRYHQPKGSHPPTPKASKCHIRRYACKASQIGRAATRDQTAPAPLSFPLETTK